jgi:farnesyl-diphosphate farnesyltransferase
MSHDALTVLKETSRTFYIPISRLPQGLREAVTAGYLCMRAIDEVEDDPHLPADAKVQILTEISQVLQSGRAKFTNEDFHRAFGDFRHQLPEVSLRIDLGSHGGDERSHGLLVIAALGDSDGV